MRRRALFCVLPAETSSAPHLSTDSLSIIRDYAARGHVIVPTLPEQIDPRSRLAIADQIRARIGAHVATVLCLDGVFEPRAIWDAARTHALDLERSVLVTSRRQLSGLFHIAGVTRVMTPRDAAAIYHAA